MNFKKRFEKRIEEDKRSMLTESDRAYLATLQNMVVERPEGEVVAKPVNYKKPLLISVACFLAVALAISLILYFTLSKPKLYMGDDFTEAETSIEELNSDLSDFSLVVDESKYSFDYIYKYLSDSGDTLYYKLAINDGQSLNIQLKIVVNKNYINSDMEYGPEILESAISGYSLIYTQAVTPMPTGYNTVNCKGEMRIGTQWIYVMSYREFSSGEGTFIDTMQSIVHIK